MTRSLRRPAHSPARHALCAGRAGDHQSIKYLHLGTLWTPAVSPIHLSPPGASACAAVCSAASLAASVAFFLAWRSRICCGRMASQVCRRAESIPLPRTRPSVTYAP